VRVTSSTTSGRRSGLGPRPPGSASSLRKASASITRTRPTNAASTCSTSLTTTSTWFRKAETRARAGSVNGSTAGTSTRTHATEPGALDCPTPGGRGTGPPPLREAHDVGGRDGWCSALPGSRCRLVLVECDLRQLNLGEKCPVFSRRSRETVNPLPHGNARMGQRLVADAT
jgi:hypothetical protein